MHSKTNIFVIYHKFENPIKSDIFLPICVGNSKSDFSGEFLHDDEGENIADKNKIYNELTAIYWVYKHLEDFRQTEYIGFSHYRRLFCFGNQRKSAYVRKSNDPKFSDVNEEQLTKIFLNYDFVVPKASHYKSVRKHYEKSHNKNDIGLLLGIIASKHPNYLDDAKQYFEGKNEYLYNMFIFQKDDFVAYCHFIFPVIEEFLKKRSNNNRLYVSERLTGIFITHLLNNGKRVLDLPILHIRSKSLKLANKQVRENFKSKFDRGFAYKLKPLILCFLPKSVEQHFRRRKTK